MAVGHSRPYTNLTPQMEDKMSDMTFTCICSVTLTDLT